MRVARCDVRESGFGMKIEAGMYGVALQHR